MITKLVIALCLAATLTGCTASIQKPVGVGNGTNQLKKSPCACLHLPLPHQLPSWLSVPMPVTFAEDQA